MSSGSTRQRRYREKKKVGSRPVNFYISQEVHEKFADLRLRSKRTDLREEETLTLDYFFTLWVNTVAEILERHDSKGRTIAKIADMTLQLFGLRPNFGVFFTVFIDMYDHFQSYYPDEFPLSKEELREYADRMEKD